MNNLGTYHDRWFKTYKGLIYKNTATDINTAINNKAIIDGKQRTVIKILTISETTNP